MQSKILDIYHVFQEQLLVLVLTANATPALSLLAFVGFLLESLLTGGFRAIPEGVQSA